MSKAGIGKGKCWEFQNQSRFSSDSRRCSSNNAQYGYISSQPSQPVGVSIENGLGKSAISALDVANAPPLLVRCRPTRLQVRLSGFLGARQDTPPVRTLVISDLHLGARLRRDVLRRGPALEALLEALAGVDRLVLLGDIVELLEGRPEQAMDAAQPVLRAFGERLGRGAEVIVVPGNHDGDLVGPWLRRHGMSAGLDASIPRDATPVLERLTGWLGPAEVLVR